MPQLSAALRTIHADHDWWKKILLGGALWLTVIGWTVVEGHQLESIENSQNGFPTPLPRWNDLGSKAVIGLFALIIDFFYFLFPILLGGFVFFCGTLVAGLTGNAGAVRVIGLSTVMLMGLYMAGVWLVGASAVAKQRYVTEGDLPEGLSGSLVRELLRSPARGIYLRARLLSLPPYLFAAGVLVLGLWLFGQSVLVGFLAVWLGLSALVYARLVTIQLYIAASRALESRR